MPKNLDFVEREIKGFFLNKTKAFTLAEVLVTLSVIGIIAAFVLPGVIRKYQESINVTKLREVYSQLNAAFNVAVQQFGPPQYWGLLNSSTNNFDEDGKQYGYIPSENIPYERLLIGLKKELIDGKEKAYQPEAMHGGGGIITKQRPIYRLSNGTTLLYPAYISSGKCTASGGTAPYTNICGDIKVDLNGFAPPNKYGHDVFVFYFTKKGFFPIGGKNNNTSIKTHCDMSLTEQDYNGFGCAAWVIEKGNMNYLRHKIEW